MTSLSGLMTRATVKDDTVPDDYILATAWQGKQKIEVVKVPRPTVTDPEDAVLKITSTAICGSDLHLYVNAMPGMKAGDLVGHEFMGIVEEVGPNVKHIKKGDRVVSSFDIGCGQCFYCQRGLFTSCATTNPSEMQAAMYGQATGGFHGYSHLTGGKSGGQAQYSRVPYADVNLLKVPDALSDSKVLLLSDVLPTAWHATELGAVSEGDRVAIWGAGPVGILAAQCAFVRGAARVVLIDQEQDRLDFATARLPKLETINFQQKKVPDALKEMLGPDAPDVSIEAVGFHYTKSWLHKIEMSLMMETDPSEILNEIIFCTRKGGRIGVVGVYSGFTNHFNIGAFMEKGLTMRAGQTPVQRYWKNLLKYIEEGKLTPDMVITHNLPLSQAAEGYKMFNDKTQGCVKVVLKPWENEE